MGFNCGIVDLPNVGKSILFNTLAKSGIAVEDFPFCTTKPNSGIVPMPDARLNALAEIAKPERVLLTAAEFVNIAGLVAGASKDEGLGNKFPASIRETDAIVHIVHYFEDDNVIYVFNSVDPKRDIEVIDLELILTDLDSCEKQLQKVARNAKSGDKKALVQKALLEKLIPHFIGGEPTRLLLKDLGDEEERLIRSFHLLTSKPVIYIANIAEDGFEDNSHLDVVKAIVEEKGAVVVSVCNKIEAEIVELEDGEEGGTFLESLGLGEPGLSRVARADYGLLNLQTYFTAGMKEVRTWTVRVGATAPQTAGVIHTDFEKGFTHVEAVTYNDFIQFEGKQDAKEAGKWRLEGKDYIVKDDDVMHPRFSI